MGIKDAVFFGWKKQYQGLKSAHVRELTQLQEESTRLKRVVADLKLDKFMDQDVLANQ